MKAEAERVKAEAERVKAEAEQAKAATQLQAAELRRRMNDELNFPPNFERLVLGCIDADFCKQILVGKLLTRSTRFTYFCTAQISKFQPKIVNIFSRMNK